MRVRWVYVALALAVGVLIGAVELAVMANYLVIPIKTDLQDAVMTNQAIADQLEYLTKKVVPPPTNPLDCLFRPENLAAEA